MCCYDDLQTNKTGRDWSTQLKEVIGKNKKGCVRITPDTRLARVVTSTSADAAKRQRNETIIRGGIDGKLIEVNERLVTNAQLLRDSPLDRGYLAVIWVTNVQKLMANAAVVGNEKSS